MRNQNIAIPSTLDLQRIWSDLSNADREVFLGHSNDELTSEDSAKLMQLLANLRKQR